MNDNHAAAVWASQSTVTEPGPARAAIDELPAGFRALREASSQLEFHYRAGGDFAENGVPADRARVGFAAYFFPGWLVDHVVAEVWDAAEGRWRLVDPEMNADWTPELNGRPVDWTDLADDQFVTGPRAWQAARAGRSDPERHVVAPNLEVPVLRGWPYLAHNVIHDLAALNKTEMLQWDAWGMQLGHGPGPVPETDAAVLDEVCARTADPGFSADDIAALAGRDGLRVPAAVTSFDPYGGPPREVTLRAAGRLSTGFR
jgi:hypothetical protein